MLSKQPHGWILDDNEMCSQDFWEVGAELSWAKWVHTRPQAGLGVLLR